MLNNDLEEALDYLELLNQRWNWHDIHRNDESDFRRIQEFLAAHKRDFQKSEF